MRWRRVHPILCVYVYTCSQPLCIIPTTQIYTFSKGADYWKGKEWLSIQAIWRWHNSGREDFKNEDKGNKEEQGHAKKDKKVYEDSSIQDIGWQIAFRWRGSAICFAYHHHPLYRNNIQLLLHIYKGGTGWVRNLNKSIFHFCFSSSDDNI